MYFAQGFEDEQLNKLSSNQKKKIGFFFFLSFPNIYIYHLNHSLVWAAMTKWCATVWPETTMVKAGVYVGGGSFWNRLNPKTHTYLFPSVSSGSKKIYWGPWRRPRWLFIEFAGDMELREPRYGNLGAGLWKSETEGRPSQPGLLSRDVMKPCHHGRDQGQT